MAFFQLSGSQSNDFINEFKYFFGERNATSYPPSDFVSSQSGAAITTDEESGAKVQVSNSDGTGLTSEISKDELFSKFDEHNTNEHIKHFFDIDDTKLSWGEGASAVDLNHPVVIATEESGAAVQESNSDVVDLTSETGNNELFSTRITNNFYSKHVFDIDDVESSRGERPSVADLDQSVSRTTAILDYCLKLSQAQEKPGTFTCTEDVLVEHPALKNHERASVVDLDQSVSSTASILDYCFKLAQGQEKSDIISGMESLTEDVLVEYPSMKKRERPTVVQSVSYTTAILDYCLTRLAQGQEKSDVISGMESLIEDVSVEQPPKKKHRFVSVQAEETTFEGQDNASCLYNKELMESIEIPAEKLRQENAKLRYNLGMTAQDAFVSMTAEYAGNSSASGEEFFSDTTSTDTAASCEMDSETVSFLEKYWS